MALWLVRAGRHGEYEKKFLAESRVYLTWGKLAHDLSKVQSKDDLRALLEETYPTASKGRITNNLGQIWAFSKSIKSGDWVILPSKLKPAIHVAEVVSNYQFDSIAEDPFYHFLSVRWIAEDIPRSNFDQDILYSLGAFMTICSIRRNDAEQRVKKMAAAGWGASGTIPATGIVQSYEGETEEVSEQLENLEEAAKDQLAKRIIAKYKGSSD